MDDQVTPLEIPERALKVACEAYDGALGEEFRAPNAQWSGGTEHSEHAAVRAAAPIIVAAELRRLATRTNDERAQTWLRQRADELDPEGAQ